MGFRRSVSNNRRDIETTENNATAVSDIFTVPPTQYLFRRAHAAIRPPGFVGVGLRGRDSVGPTCAANETKCTEGDWCCDTGEACSLDNGAFLCCPSGLESVGCSRVCSVGEFQCGAVCCAKGQTCGGGDSATPFCVNSSTSSTALTTSPTLSTARPSTTISRPTTTSAPKTRPSVSADDFSTLELAPTKTGTFTPVFPTHTSTSAGQQPTSDSVAGTGLPLAAQIAMGVIVPVVVILIVASLWFFLCRGPRRRSPYSGGEDDRPPPPPPKNGIPAATLAPSHHYTSSRTRSPVDSVRTESTVEMAMLPKDKKGKPHIAAALSTPSLAPSLVRHARVWSEERGIPPQDTQVGVGVAR